MTARRTAGVVVIALLLAACGAPDLGEECDQAGSKDECVEGAVCTNEDGRAVCRALCDDHEDCARSESCNGVSDTNLKSCQPED